MRSPPAHGLSTAVMGRSLGVLAVQGPDPLTVRNLTMPIC